MREYRRIEDMNPEIRAFFESVGTLKLDDEETPEICFCKPYNGEPEHSIAITVSELRWLRGTVEDEYIDSVCKNRPGDEWLYRGLHGWISEEEMLRLIKLKAFL